ILSRLPVLELAAGSLHGEQAVANLLKIRQLAAELADRPDLTLAGFVDRLVARVSEQRDEAESSLVEETLDAVRVLTIHKAKGLEFPVVVLPGLHQESGGGGAWSVGQDWSTGVTGVRIGEWCNVGALVVGDKMRVREEAERKRLFYVGWTRARDRLILSGGVTARSSRDSFLALLRAVAGDGVGAADSPALRIGEAELTQRVSRMAESRPRGMERRPKTLAPAREVPGLVARWEERDRRWAQALATRSVLSPTRLMAEAGRVPPGTTRPTHDGQAARRLGTLVHRALEGWDFRRDPGELAAYAKMIGRLVLAEADGLESGDGDRLLEELESLLITFRETAPYAELQRADILGREVPFAFPWILPDTRSSALSLPAAGLRQAAQQSSTAVMEGVLDVLYRLDGRLWVADFKTDRVEAGGLQDLLARYRVQVGIYREAVARALGCGDVGFKFIFVRTGEAQVLD
ncbi:MAG: 3'-5' exonuclease, partial [Nitrospirales bacterium]